MLNIFKLLFITALNAALRFSIQEFIPNIYNISPLCQSIKYIGIGPKMKISIKDCTSLASTITNWHHSELVISDRFVANSHLLDVMLPI